MRSCVATGMIAVCHGLVGTPGIAEESVRDFTCFQVAAPYTPEIDVGSDVAIVYGVNASFPDRVAQWRDKGYAVSMMTGISWGGYDSYYGSGEDLKRDEIQTVKSGKLLMHGNSASVGYNVPSQSYIDYIKRYIEPAVEAEVRAIYLEEPEYWTRAGWSDGFKKEWQKFYGEPWQEPDSSPDAQYRASKLKYELYFSALKQVFEYIDEKAKARGIDIECVVPTHSLVNYAQWGIVSPESHLIDLPTLDGYIAQVWTGTARCPNIYRGISKERTFETAFLEYGQMAAMVQPTGRKVWFLADPIEDNPNRTWTDYKRNYECTVVASLMHPEVHHYEVMPWPDRIFKGTYPKADLGEKSGEREGIPADYATQILVIINALNEMNQPDIAYDTGTRGVGVVISDTAMFQRAAPAPGDRAFGGLYGLALPLIKAGIPVDMVQLENTIYPAALDACKVLLLTYEHQKPLKPEYHAALTEWVRGGGCLLYFGNGSDPYHGVREWWNEQGKKPAKAYDDLFARLGAGEKATQQTQPVGDGFVRVIRQNPSQIQTSADGAALVREAVADMLARRGKTLRVQHYLSIRRGPFIVTAVLDEAESDDTFPLTGTFVDLLEPDLPVVRERTYRPDERGLLYDLEWARRNGLDAKVVAAGARIRDEKTDGDAFSFVARGPLGTTANARVVLPSQPRTVTCEPPVEVEQRWDEQSGTLWMSFPNRAEDMTFRIGLE